MRIQVSILFAALVGLIIAGGCTPPGPVDEAVKEALNNVLQTEEFTQQERDAVQSIKVHNEEAKVWLKSGFSTDQQTVTAVAEHVGKVLAKTFYQTAMSKGYMEDKYNIEVWMRASDSKGPFNALVAEWAWNIQTDRTVGNNYGTSRTREIR